MDTPADLGVARPAPGRRPFDWLRDRRGRRSALRDVRAAIRRGWLDGTSLAHKTELMAVLDELLDVPDLSRREVIGIDRVLLRIDQGADPRVNKPPDPRRVGRAGVYSTGNGLPYL